MDDLDGFKLVFELLNDVNCIDFYENYLFFVFLVIGWGYYSWFYLFFYVVEYELCCWYWV